MSVGIGSVVGSLALPVAIAAACIVPLSDLTAPAVEGFFALETVQQVAVFGLVFAIVFGAVSLAVIVSVLNLDGGSASGGGVKKTPEDYPLEEMADCSSDKDKFLCLYPMLRDELLDLMETDNEMDDEAVNWCREMMDYNVPGGKLNRGTTVVAVYRALTPPGKPFGDYEIARASVLGWAIEFLQAFFLVADDVMDDSVTRRGQPCWYKKPSVAKIAINDSFLLESFVFGIIREHFGEEAYYSKLLHLLLDICQKTEFGQLLDLTSQPSTADKSSKTDLERFTLDRYRRIVKYKTAFYSFYLPVAMGILLSEMFRKQEDEDQALDTAKRICCAMGEYFQIQDDYLDCFGDPAVIGKVGTDIQENKCSWLVVQALQRSSPGQRKVLEVNYGQWDDAKVGKVKELYRQLDLPKVFAGYEENSYQAIQGELDNLTMPRDVFEVLLKKIYKRSK